MKQIRKLQLLLLVFIMAIGFAVFTENAQAAKKAAKSKVTYKLKKGTLTISGKGAMPKSMTFSKNKKIKKVVIKKGVTSVPDDAFSYCKNLRSVKLPSSLKKIGYFSFYGASFTEITIPSSVKKIGQGALNGNEKLKKVTMPGDYKFLCPGGEDSSYWVAWPAKLETLRFNTKLSLESVARLDTDNLYVWEKDSKYKSINGVIYSKDGKSIVRVPSLRKTLTIEEGCTEFCLQSILYSNQDYESDPDGGCTALKKITIPASVTKVDNEKYYAIMSQESKVKDVEIKTGSLDGHSIMVLVNWINSIGLEQWMKLLPELIQKSGDMYMAKDGVCLRYSGKEKNVTLPENTTEIGENAFYNCYELVNINLPKNVTRLGESAFENCSELKEIVLHENIKFYGERVFANTGITQVKLPSNMTEIPDYMFVDSSLKSIVIPDSVKVIGEGAFGNCTSLASISLGKGVQTVKSCAFSGTRFSELTVPANVKIIEYGAFYSNIKGTPKVTLLGSTKIICEEGFDSKIAFTYKCSPKKYRTCLSLSEWRQKGKKSTIRFSWNKVSGVSGYQLKYSWNKKFKKNVTTMKVKKSKTSIKVTSRVKGKAVYAKIRPYTVVKGKKVYGKWSNVV